MSEATRPARALVRCPFCGQLNRVDLERAKDRPKCGQCSRPLLLDRPIPITDADFDRVVGESDATVLVDFYADWCGPCKIMAPILDQIASQHIGSVLVAKLDTDRNPTSARKFGIRGIPTLIAFRGGKEVGRETGAVPRQSVEALIDRAGKVAGADGR